MPAMDFLRDGEIYRDGPGRSELGTTEGRHARAHTGLIAVSFHRLFLGGLLPSRARFRFTG
jgi:hypothetical protein